MRRPNLRFGSPHSAPHPGVGGADAAQYSDAVPEIRATRILLVDDHDLVREGLTALLQRVPDMLVVGCAANGEDAVAAAKTLNPNIVLMDLVLPGINGLDASRRILCEWPLTHIIALSGCQTSDHVHRALQAGVRGYVTKSSAGADLVIAIRSVQSGAIYVSPGILMLPTDPRSHRRQARDSVGHLSERERQVLSSLVDGLSSAAIGRQLSLSPKSVDTYRHRLMVKLGAANRSALIRMALEYHLTVV